MFIVPIPRNKEDFTSPEHRYWFNFFMALQDYILANHGLDDLMADVIHLRIMDTDIASSYTWTRSESLFSISLKKDDEMIVVIHTTVVTSIIEDGYEDSYNMQLSVQYSNKEEAESIASAIRLAI